jgi:hypothetical protein
MAVAEYSVNESIKRNDLEMDMDNDHDDDDDHNEASLSEHDNDNDSHHGLSSNRFALFISSNILNNDLRHPVVGSLAFLFKDTATFRSKLCLWIAWRWF